VDFDDVLNKRIPPPYFPTIVRIIVVILLSDGFTVVQNGSADTSNFDEEFTKEQPTLTPVHGTLSSRDQAQFNGFSWVSSWAIVPLRCLICYARVRWPHGQMCNSVISLVLSRRPFVYYLLRPTCIWIPMRSICNPPLLSSSILVSGQGYARLCQADQAAALHPLNSLVSAHS
jgi:Protein kinase C terminal domain